MVVLATPFSQVSGAPVAVPGSRGQSVTGGSGLSQEGVKRALAVNTSGPHIVGQMVRSPELVDIGVSRVLRSRVVGFLRHAILEESGMGRRGYPPEFRRKVGGPGGGGP